MTAEAGLAALWLAAALAALQVVLGTLALRSDDEAVLAAVRPVAIVQGALTALAMAMLIAVFLLSDMSVKLVVENSHSAKPWIYKFAGAWGNHEGSMLLWVTILGVAGAGVALPIGVLPFAGLSLAAGLAVASAAPLWGRNLLRTPLFTWGMVVSHLGIAVALAGMACDAAFTAERLVALRAGETARVGPFTMRFDGIKPVIGENWSALEARLTATRGTAERILRPQQRFFGSPPTTTNESAIATLADGQLYTVLGQADGTGRWQMRFWWKPFVTFIWLGGALIAAGGLLSLVGRLRKRRA